MKENLTEIVFLLDRSGSMGGLESDTIGGFNAFVEKQQQGDEGEEEILVTAVLFDDRYELLWNGIRAEQARLTDREYYVRGSTALLDALGKTILDVGHRLSLTAAAERPGRVIFVITTDGLENASREFSYQQIKKLIRQQQEKYNWEFIFLGANIDVAQEADKMGVAEDSAYSFAPTAAGIDTMYALASDAVAAKRRGRKKKEKG